MAKERLDVLLVKRNLIDTREKAKRMIMAGLVFTNNERLDKAGMKVDENIPLRIKGKLPYVSRGGLKLEKALQVFDVSVKDKIIVDIGASTGGFTDCALQNGAAFIYAMDVGYNQLAWKLRNHPQVDVHERTNFRYATTDLFQHGTPQFAMMDVSFISIKLIFPVLKSILLPGSDIIALIKPQFEAKKEEVGKKGIIRDPKLHASIIKEIVSHMEGIGFTCKDLNFSPITGGEGNIEFLSHFIFNEEGSETINDESIKDIVRKAHEQFKKN